MHSVESEQKSQPNPLRRKLFRGASGGVGVLLAVQAKTALGGAICQSPSAKMSGNTSPRPGGPAACSGGRSPGFWKVPQKFNYWTSPAKIPTFKAGVNVNFCSSGMQGLAITVIAANGEGTLLSSVFLNLTSTHGLWAVLAFPNDVSFAGKGQLLRHLTAAYLNSLFPWPLGTYPISTTQVLNMWTQINTCGFYNPATTSCVGTGMTGTDVIAYISGMYDIAADIPPDGDLCK